MVNSPRSLEACKRLGIQLSDLDTVTEEQVREKILERERKRSVPQVLVDMRLKHYADKRKSQVHMIKEVILKLRRFWILISLVIGTINAYRRT